MRNSWRLCLLLCFVLFAFTACTTQNTVSEKEMVKKLRSTNQYVLCIMDADTGTIIQSKNSLQSNEKLDVSFLVKKVAERLQLDVSPVNFSNEKDKLIICLTGNASVVQND